MDREVSIIRKRLMAMDLAMVSIKILDKENFPKIIEARETKNKELFLKTCKSAKISESLWDPLWCIVITPDTPDVMAAGVW